MSTRDRYDKDTLKALQSIASSTNRIANCLEKMCCPAKEYSKRIDEWVEFFEDEYKTRKDEEE